MLAEWWVHVSNKDRPFGVWLATWVTLKSLAWITVSRIADPLRLPARIRSFEGRRVHTDEKVGIEVRGHRVTIRIGAEFFVFSRWSGRWQERGYCNCCED